MKNKKVEIVDAKHHKELIGDEFEVRNIIKTEKKRKKIMKVIEKQQTFNPPKWFTVYMTEFEKRIDTRFGKIEKDIQEIKADVKRIDARIDNLVKKNNLKE